MRYTRRRAFFPSYYFIKRLDHGSTTFRVGYNTGLLKALPWGRIADGQPPRYVDEYGEDILVVAVKAVFTILRTGLAICLTEQEILWWRKLHDKSSKVAHLRGRVLATRTLVQAGLA